jgi:hypothetical protein
MFTVLFGKRTFKLMGIAVVLVAVAFTALFSATPASAHCDSEKGPVAKAAIKSLDTGEAKYILAYVQPEAEAELTTAFKQALAARKAGGTTKELADRYFMETAVRLHRMGEGAPYTGVTDEVTPQSILTADKAMASGSMDGVYKMLDAAIMKGVEEKYQAVLKAREEAEHLGTVEALREQAEAELIFEKYIYELYTAARMEVPHAEGATTGHAH